MGRASGGFETGANGQFDSDSFFRSLCSRFRPEVGLIRSWDFGDWSYPVIIDNMMNLEMLFWASEQTNNPKYREIAISHANKTLKNHFREDMTSYHVVSLSGG